MGKAVVFFSLTLAAALGLSQCSSAPQQSAVPADAQQAASEQIEARQTERIAVADLRAKLDSGERFLLIDVREDWELEEHGAIAGAVHIPMGELEEKMPDIPKDVELVFYWQSGGRAERAATMFIEAGYKAGQFCGIRDWKAEGQEVVEKVERPPAGLIQP